MKYRHTIRASTIVVSGLINPGPGFLNVKGFAAHLSFTVLDLWLDIRSNFEDIISGSGKTVMSIFLWAIFQTKQFI